MLGKWLIKFCVWLCGVLLKSFVLQVAEWTKAISVKWRELTAEQKETFQKMAATDKQRYTQQVNLTFECCRRQLVMEQTGETDLE